MVKRFFTSILLIITLNHFNEKKKKKIQVEIKHFVVLPNYNRTFRPYLDILFILSLDILKKDDTCVQCSFALNCLLLLPRIQC